MCMFIFYQVTRCYDCHEAATRAYIMQYLVWYMYTKAHFHSNNCHAANAPTAGTLMLSSTPGTSSTPAQSIEMKISFGMADAIFTSMHPVLVRSIRSNDDEIAAPIANANEPPILLLSENGHFRIPYRLPTMSASPSPTAI